MADLIHPTNRFLFPVFSSDWLEMLTLTQLLNNTKYQLNLRGKNAYYGKLSWDIFSQFSFSFKHSDSAFIYKCTPLWLCLIPTFSYQQVSLAFLRAFLSVHSLLSCSSFETSTEQFIFLSGTKYALFSLSMTFSSTLLPGSFCLLQHSVQMMTTKIVRCNYWLFL